MSTCVGSCRTLEMPRLYLLAHSRKDSTLLLEKENFCFLIILHSVNLPSGSKNGVPNTINAESAFIIYHGLYQNIYSHFG